MKKKIYEPPAVNITRVDVEQNIAMVALSGKVVLDPWPDDDIVVGGNPDTEGGEFYVFY